MRFYIRSEWGAAPPRGNYSAARDGGQGTIHWSASRKTASGGAARPKPEKPGAKWYQLWRNPMTPAIQRRRLSKQITAYNRAMAAWKKAGGASVPPALVQEEMSIVRGFQAFHQGPARGWLDIGYHRIIFASGNVYEGRPLGVSGAHAVGANHTVGYCFVMGPGDEPSGHMIDAFHEQRVKDGVRHYVGHRQRPGNSTQCPGAALTRILDL